MKRILLATLSATLPALAFAQPVIHPSGANLTQGLNSLNPSILSITANPAAPATLIGSDDSYGIGILSSIGVSFELGQVDNYVDELDNISDKLGTTFNSVNDALAFKNDADDFLVDAGENGYIIGNMAVHAPLLPIIYSGDSAITFDINISAQFYGGILDAPIIINPISQEAETATALYIKGAVVTEAALGYSRPVWSSEQGKLYAGATAKYYEVSLAKNTILLDATDDVGSTIEDEYDQNQATSSDFGLDLGLLWVADNYHAGAVLLNANSPTFDYGDVGVNCSSANCYTAAYFVGKGDIDSSETHTMDAQVRLETSVHSENKHWSLSASYDTNAVLGPVGNEIQWTTVAIAYMPNSTWIPGVRAGYRANMAGSELSMITAGVTLFKGLNLDLAYGLDEIESEGETLPRTAAVNLGLEMRF